MSKARSTSATDGQTNFLAAKEVPDFERLYKKFVSTLERNKGSRFTTVPEPFSFDGRDEEAKIKRTEQSLQGGPNVFYPGN